MSDISSNIEALKRLSELKDKGHITAEEFAAQKKLLLGETPYVQPPKEQSLSGSWAALNPSKIETSKVKISTLVAGAVILLIISPLPVGYGRAKLNGLDVPTIMELHGLAGLAGIATSSPEELQRMPHIQEMHDAPLEIKNSPVAQAKVAIRASSAEPNPFDTPENREILSKHGQAIQSDAKVATAPVLSKNETTAKFMAPQEKDTPKSFFDKITLDQYRKGIASVRLVELEVQMIQKFERQSGYEFMDKLDYEDILSAERDVLKRQALCSGISEDQANEAVKNAESYLEGENSYIPAASKLTYLQYVELNSNGDELATIKKLRSTGAALSLGVEQFGQQVQQDKAKSCKSPAPVVMLEDMDPAQRKIEIDKLNKASDAEENGNPDD